MNTYAFYYIWYTTDRRFMRNPFCTVTADKIIELIALGHRLTSICKMKGMPTYQVLCKWRRQIPYFNEDIVSAYEDRYWLYKNQFEEAFARNGFRRNKLIRKLEAETNRQIGSRYRKTLLQKKHLKKIVIDTGIGIRPFYTYVQQEK